MRQPPDSEQWLHQPKLDGWRCQAVKVGTTVALYSRNGNELTKRFPAIVGAMVKLPAKTVVLDGDRSGRKPTLHRSAYWLVQAREQAVLPTSSIHGHRHTRCSSR